MLVGIGRVIIWSLMVIVIDIYFRGGLLSSVCWSELLGDGCEVCDGSCRKGDCLHVYVCTYL